MLPAGIFASISEFFIDQYTVEEKRSAIIQKDAWHILGVDPTLLHHTYSTADEAEQVTHAVAVCMSARVVKNTLTLTLAPALLA